MRASKGSPAFGRALLLGCALCCPSIALELSLCHSTPGKALCPHNRPTARAQQTPPNQQGGPPGPPAAYLVHYAHPHSAAVGPRLVHIHAVTACQAETRNQRANSRTAGTPIPSLEQQSNKLHGAAFPSASCRCSMQPHRPHKMRQGCCSGLLCLLSGSRGAQTCSRCEMPELRRPAITHRPHSPSSDSVPSLYANRSVSSW